MRDTARFTNGSWELPPNARGVLFESDRRAAQAKLEREQAALREQLKQVRAGVRHV